MKVFMKNKKQLKNSFMVIGALSVWIITFWFTSFVMESQVFAGLTFMAGIVFYKVDNKERMLHMEFWNGGFEG